MPVTVKPGGTNKDNLKGGQTTSPGIPIMVSAIVLLVLFVGWIAYKNLAPPPHEAGPTQESKNDWISQIAVKAGGDYSKVDPADRQKLDIYTGGKGADLIKSKYQAATH